jgi:hypothetical protein
MQKQIDILPTPIFPEGIKTGDCLLVSGTSFLAHAIQTFEGIKWNHAAVFVWIDGDLYVVEAAMKGIMLTLFSEYTKDKTLGLLIMKPQFPMPDEITLSKFMLPYVSHTDYGFLNLLFYQAIRFLTKKKLWLGGKKDPMTHNFICGEWAAFVYNHYNPTLFDDWNRLAPSDLFECGLFTQLLFQ